MAFEPICIFSANADPLGVVTFLQRRGCHLEISGPYENWQRIVITLTRSGIVRNAQSLTLEHSAEYYRGDEGKRQMLGMLGYFSSFPDHARKPDVLRAIAAFQFAISISQHDLDIESRDERLPLLYDLCRHLDGAIFSPSALRDSQGRILLSNQGDSDPAAVLPQSKVEPDWFESVPLLDRDENGDEWDEPMPPPAQRVARRTICLTAVAARATLELDAPHLDNAEQHRHQILEWIAAVGVEDELEPDEWKVLQRPTGSLDERAFINSMWRVEGLAVLAWALKLHPLPPYDELVIPSELYAATHLFDGPGARQLLANPTLRTAEELAEMGVHLLMAHWRLRNYSIRPEAMDFVEFSHNSWIGSFDISKFRIVNGDLAIGDAAIHNASEEEISRVHSIAMERHQAIRWLQGDNEVYSETDTST